MLVDRSEQASGAHQGAQAEPGRGGGVHAANPRAGLPRDLCAHRLQPLPLRDGEHPRSVLMGARGQPSPGAGEGPHADPHGRREGASPRAAACG